MIDDCLHTFTISLYADHLGLAAEALYRIKDSDRRSKNAISSIMHSYCGLESAVNYIGYQLFFDSESEKYIKEEDRDLPLRRMINNWNSNLSCLEKIEYVLSIYKIILSPKLKNELLELNNLRNWLTHGFSYKQTLLLEPKNDEKNTFNLIDKEDSIDWIKKFPNTKFNPLDSLERDDAKKAFRIIMETLVIISTATGQPFYMATYYKNPNISLISNDTDIDKIIDRE